MEQRPALTEKCLLCGKELVEKYSSEVFSKDGQPKGYVHFMSCRDQYLAEHPDDRTKAPKG